MSCAEVERRAEEDEVVVAGRRSRNRASLRTNRSRVEESGEDADEEFDCRESCSECVQNHAYGASRRVCQFAGERGKSWPFGRASSVGHDREVVQSDIGAGEGDRRTHSGQRGMAIDCLERGKAGERDGGC